jgi:drug/metabolite transporter (DMT)-like permease
MMLCHVITLSILYAAVKMLAEDLSSSLVVFMYKIAILILIIPICLAQGLQSMKTHKLLLHFIRAFFSICGSLCMFYAIKHITLADISAVQYMEHILLLIIGVIYFGEQATKTKVIVIGISFLGALIVIRPDLIEYCIYGTSIASNGFNKYYIFVFFAILFWSLNSCMVKILGRTEKTSSQVFYTTLFSCILSFPAAFMHWETVHSISLLEIKLPTHLVTFAETNLSLKHLFPIMLLGCLYFIHSITHFKALKHADISLVVPFEYARLIFAGILGYLCFNEIPNSYSYIGYSLIVGAGLYLIFSERRRYRKRKAREAQQLQEEFGEV